MVFGDGVFVENKRKRGYGEWNFGNGFLEIMFFSKEKKKDVFEKLVFGKWMFEDKNQWVFKKWVYEKWEVEDRNKRIFKKCVFEEDGH